MIDFRALLVESDKTMKDAEVLAELDKEPATRVLSDEMREMLTGVRRHRQFAQIKAGRFSVSVQASHSHYCEPRITTNDVMRYETWEVFCAPMGDDLVKLLQGTTHKFSLDLWQHFLRDGYDERPRPTDPAAYVPTSTVQEYLELLEAFGGEGPVLDAASTTAAGSVGDKGATNNVPESVTALGAAVVDVAPSDEEGTMTTTSEIEMETRKKSSEAAKVVDPVAVKIAAMQKMRGVRYQLRHIVESINEMTEPFDAFTSYLEAGDPENITAALAEVTRLLKSVRGKLAVAEEMNDV